MATSALLPVRTLLLAALALAGLRAQEADPNGAAQRATHAPLPHLHPLDALRHLQRGNAALLAARRAREAAPEPAPRPSGAGRYVCAVLVCADADADVPALLGLRRQDVLVLAAPGPFVSPETAALLDRVVAEERLSLIVVLGHEPCRSLAPTVRAGEPPDALQRRAALVHAAALRSGRSPATALVRAQCEQLRLALDRSRAALARDRLRIVPAVLDVREQAVQFVHRPADELPIAPVR